MTRAARRSPPTSLCRRSQYIRCDARSTIPCRVLCRYVYRRYAGCIGKVQIRQSIARLRKPILGNRKVATHHLIVRADGRTTLTVMQDPNAARDRLVVRICDRLSDAPASSQCGSDPPMLCLFLKPSRPQNDLSRCLLSSNVSRRSRIAVGRWVDVGTTSSPSTQQRSPDSSIVVARRCALVLCGPTTSRE